MKPSLLTTIFVSLSMAMTSQGALIIAGVIDGDLTGGNPKAIIIQATSAIADLSTFGVGSANNGGGSDGEEFTLSGSASAGQYIIISANTASTTFFNDNFTSSNFLLLQNATANINGNDAIELFSDGLVIDTYGDINVIGDDETWNYSDGYTVRTGGTAGIFDQVNFDSVSQGLENQNEAQHATTLGGAFNNFNSTPIPEPSSTAFIGLVGLTFILRRKRSNA